MSIATVVTEGYGSFGSIGAVVLQGYFDGAAPTPTPPAAIEGAGGGYHRHGRQKALDWRVRDKRELQRILKELGESPKPEVAERVAEIRQDNAKKQTPAQKREAERRNEPPPVDAAKLVRDLEAARWLVETYDALMLAELELQAKRKRRLQDEIAILLLM